MKCSERSEAQEQEKPGQHEGRTHRAESTAEAQPCTEEGEEPSDESKQRGGRTQGENEYRSSQLLAQFLHDTRLGAVEVPFNLDESPLDRRS